MTAQPGAGRAPVPVPTPVEVAPGVLVVEDSCRVHVIRDEHEPHRAVLIDFGTGAVLDALPLLGITQVDAVLMTHHHRDQGQGLPRAVAAGIPIHVPPGERALFDDVEQLWQGRSELLDYTLRQDRFSLLASVPVAGEVPLYRTMRFGGTGLRVVPTPGHTPGSVTYLLDRVGADGAPARIGFTGDLIHSPGRVHSLAATQWSYTENEGPAMTVLSALLLREERPTLLLPSHGEPMPEADAALALLGVRMQRYVDSRRAEPWDLADVLAHPYVRISEHLLRNRTSNAYSYVLLSGTGEALLIDYGYDLTTGLPPGADRAGRVVWLASLAGLRRDFGVHTIEVVLPTHYHDDHVAGIPLLREVEGTQVWIPQNVVAPLAQPGRTDLPCQWFEPIAPDRVLELGGTVEWRGIHITTHPLPGHTRYAAAFSFEVDGMRVLATGDQQTDPVGQGPRSLLNYQYRNRFRPADYVASAALYTALAPGLFVTGHWRDQPVDGELLAELARQGEEVVRLHDELLPAGAPVDDRIAQLEPFHTRMPAGGPIAYRAFVLNPTGEAAEVRVEFVLPDGWTASPADAVGRAEPGERIRVDAVLTAPASARRRDRIALDVRIGERALGQLVAVTADVLAGDARADG